MLKEDKINVLNHVLQDLQIADDLVKGLFPVGPRLRVLLLLGVQRCYLCCQTIDGPYVK